jgi:hypothetical protein
MSGIIFDADFSKFFEREDVVEMQKRQKSSNKTSTTSESKTQSPNPNLQYDVVFKFMDKRVK